PGEFKRRSNMLQDSLFETQRRTKTRKPITVVVSVIAHVLSIGALALIPLLQTQAITIPPIDASLLLPRVEKPQAVPVFSAHPEARRHNRADANVPILTTPQALPTKVVFVDEPPKADGFLPSGPGPRVPGFGNPLIEAGGTGIEPPSPPPPPPPPPIAN